MIIMNVMETKESSLSKHPIFMDLPKDKLAEIARDAKDEVVPANSIVFQEGDPGDRFYIINSGKVRLFKKSREGVELPLVELGPGEFFGQVAILTEDRRWMNVETEEKTHLTIIPKDSFEEILENYPKVSLAFAKQMSRYLARDDLIIKKKSERAKEGPRASWLDFSVIFFLSLLGGIIFNYSNPNGINLTPEFMEIEAILSVTPSQAIGFHGDEGTLFVDARPSTLYQQEHIAGAVNIPLSIFDIMYMMKLSEIDRNKRVIVYGRTISSLYDKEMARKLNLRGHDNIMILKGGLSVWKKKGYPVKT